MPFSAICELIGSAKTTLYYLAADPIQMPACGLRPSKGGTPPQSVYSLGNISPNAFIVILEYGMIIITYRHVWLCYHYRISVQIDENNCLIGCFLRVASDGTGHMGKVIFRDPNVRLVGVTFPSSHCFDDVLFDPALCRRGGCSYSKTVPRVFGGVNACYC